MAKRNRPGMSYNRDNRRTTPGPAGSRWAGICQPTGKRIWITRADAKSAMKALHPDDNRMRVYPCNENPEHFHFGHTRAKWPTMDRSLPVHCGYPAPHPAHVWSDELRRPWACPGTPNGNSEGES